MSLSPLQLDRLHDLLFALRDDCLDANDQQELEAFVLAEPDARRLFVRTMHLHASLLWTNRAEAGVRDQVPGVRAENPKFETNLKSEIANPKPPPPTPHPLSPIAHSHSASPVHGFLRHTTSVLKLPVVWSILGVGVLFAGYFVTISWNLLAGKLPSGTTGVDSFVATISGVGDAVWSDSSSFPLSPGGAQGVPGDEGTDVRAGESLQIDAGLVKLKLKQGATLLIEGPAEWSVDGHNSVSLRAGKLTARVPEQAIGFTVETPTAQIVDLGTEFGVEVVGRETSMQVFEGVVEFSPHVSQTSSGGEARAATQRLRAGKAARTDLATGRTVATKFVSEKFVREVARTAKPASHVLWIDLKKEATATQSSNHPTADVHPPQAAIDGDPQTASHTDVDDSPPWWQLDLGRTHPIAVVVLSNRRDGQQFGGWLRDITIKIIAEDGKTVVTSSPLLNPKNSSGGGEHDFDHGPAQIAFEPIRAQGKPAVGRFVRVERKPCTIDEVNSFMARARKNALVLGEVQVFESPKDKR